MKRLLPILLIFSFFFSCEDVIELDLPSSEPKLVIDASITWFKGTAGNEQSIKLSLSAPYFDSEIPPASGASVQIEDADGNLYVFSEDGNSGIYTNSNFQPVINLEYTLTIIYDGETYAGSEVLTSVVDIDYVEQNLEGGFTGEDIELKAYFTDPADEENYYFFEYIPDAMILPSFDIYNDDFINGNLFFGFYLEPDLSIGDQVTIRSHGVSQRFYDFMFILLQQTPDEGGGPFETQPASVRGNCINLTNPDNYPLGYFRLSEVSEVVYTIVDN